MPLDDGSLARGWVLRGRAFWLIRTVPVGIFAVRVRRAGGGGYRSLNKPYMAMGPVAIYCYLSGISRRRPNPFWARGAPMRRSPPPAEDDHPRLQAAPSPWLVPYAVDAPPGLIGVERPRPPQLSPAREVFPFVGYAVRGGRPGACAAVFEGRPPRAAGSGEYFVAARASAPDGAQHGRV